MEIRPQKGVGNSRDRTVVRGGESPEWVLWKRCKAGETEETKDQASLEGNVSFKQKKEKGPTLGLTEGET